MVTASTESSANEYEGKLYHSQVAILFIIISLCLGALCRQLLRSTRIPYTVALLLIGIALGAFEHEVENLGRFGASIRMWSEIEPELILYIFLPALLFESSFSFEYHQVKRCLLQMFILAVPGVGLSTFLLGLTNKFVLPYDWNWSTSLLLGGLLSATDPVAVVALLKDLGASKKLNTIIEGESLMNDGTAIVVFQLFLKIVLGKSTSIGSIIEFLSRVCLGAISIGLLLGIIYFFWLRSVFNDYVMEITLTITASYLAFYLVNDVTAMSGVLAVMTLGIFLATFAKTLFTGDREKSMHNFWEMIAYIANTLIFVLSGVIIAETVLDSANYIEGKDWGYLIVLYIFVQISRFLVVFALFPFLKSSGYGLTVKEALILTWSGLRGAVALTLALLISKEPDTDRIKEATKARFLFFTGGVVFLTLIVNGSTVQFLLSLLKMDKTSETKKRILDYTRQEMYDKALEAFGEFGEDEELGPSDWPTVRKYISCLNKNEPRVERMISHPHHTVSMQHMRLQQLHDTRIRFLNGIQASYWSMLEEGRINQTSALILMQSVAESIDLTTKKGKLDMWTSVRVHIRYPKYLKHIQRWRFIPKGMCDYFITNNLGRSVTMAAAYLKSLRYARQQLLEFLGQTKVSETVIEESKEEEIEAKKFLEGIKLSFPQVLRTVKTKQVTYAILISLCEYVDSLDRAGLLDEKETTQLQLAVEKDLKNLLQQPPAIDMPSVSQMLMSHPTIGSLPAHIRRQLADNAKHSTKLQGSIIYKEGAEPDGIWLIASGLVKWSSTATDGKIMLHPTFTHGSTLGLYEVLTGQQRICAMEVESVINCFFIESSIILSVLNSDADVADFLWQECALVLSRVILFSRFESLSIQELRLLIFENSKLISMPAQAMLELSKTQEIAILLEGKMQQDDVAHKYHAPSALTYQGEINLNASFTDLMKLTTRYKSLSDVRILLLQVPVREEALTRTNTLDRKGSDYQLIRHGSHDHEGLLQWSSGIEMDNDEEEKGEDDTEKGGGSKKKGGEWNAKVKEKENKTKNGKNESESDSYSDSDSDYESDMLSSTVKIGTEEIAQKALELSVFGKKFHGEGKDLSKKNKSLSRTHSQSKLLHKFADKRKRSFYLNLQPNHEDRFSENHTRAKDQSNGDDEDSQKGKGVEERGKEKEDTEEHVVRIDSLSDLFPKPQ